LAVGTSGLDDLETAARDLGHWQATVCRSADAAEASLDSVPGPDVEELPCPGLADRVANGPGEKRPLARTDETVSGSPVRALQHLMVRAVTAIWAKARP
jgi:hypothetical protein